jgi:hypothetical protein
MTTLREWLVKDRRQDSSDAARAMLNAPAMTGAVANRQQTCALMDAFRLIPSRKRLSSASWCGLGNLVSRPPLKNARNRG